jgi:hypothetical protein
VLIRPLVILTLVTILIATATAASAAKVGTSLNLTFDSATDGEPVDPTMNNLLNNFIVVSQDYLDKASPVLMKALDKSSPTIYEIDKSSPQLFKALDRASPKLMDIQKKWIDLAKQIDEDTYTANVGSAQNPYMGQITITSDSGIVVIHSEITWVTSDGENASQNITMTGDVNTEIFGLKVGGGVGTMSWSWGLHQSG